MQIIAIKIQREKCEQQKANFYAKTYFSFRVVYICFLTLRNDTQHIMYTTLDNFTRHI